MSKPRILIAGIGNIFFGDDAFGVEMAARLAARDLPEEVRVIDFGIRGYDLAYAMVEGYETVLLLDATPRGGAPGSLYLIQPQGDERRSVGLDAHAMDPVKVLQFARTLGEPLPHLLLVGCEPTPIDTEDMLMGLSPPVEGALDEAVELVESIIGKLLSGRGHETIWNECRNAATTS